MKGLVAVTCLILLAGPAAAGGGHAGEWIELPALNFARQESGTAVLDGVVYIIGGLIIRPGQPTTDTVETWRSGDAAWSFAPDLPEAVDHPAVAVHGGEIWVLGGERQQLPKTHVQIFDGPVGEWRLGPPLPEARSAGAAASLNGRLYYFGGIDGDRVETAVPLVLEPGATEWTELEPMSLARDHLSAVTLGEAIYVTGGRLGFISRDVHERWSPEPASWTTLDPVPTARSAAGAAALGGLLWVGGGEFPGVFGEHEVYDPATGTWQVAPSLPVPRHGTQPVAIDGMIVWPGGGVEAGFMPTDRVDAFVPERIFGDGFELGNTSLWSSTLEGGSP